MSRARRGGSLSEAGYNLAIAAFLRKRTSPVNKENFGRFLEDSGATILRKAKDAAKSVLIRAENTDFRSLQQIQRKTKTGWRRWWDLNPRARFCQATRFRGGLFQPLRHLSTRRDSQLNKRSGGLTILSWCTGARIVLLHNPV